MTKLVIMDINTQTIDVYNVDSENDINIEDLGYNSSECSWFYTEGDLNISFKEKTLR